MLGYKQEALLAVAKTKKRISIRDAIRLGYRDSKSAEAVLKALETQGYLIFQGWGWWTYNGDKETDKESSEDSGNKI